MSKRPNKSRHPNRTHPPHVAQAMRQRVMQRIAVNGRAKLPAVPGLVEEIVGFCSGMWKASGRPLLAQEAADAKRIIGEQLQLAFSASPRSKIDVVYEAEPACPLVYKVEPDLRSIPDAYERWIGTHEGPLFGAHPDAKVLAMVAECVDRPATWPVMDFGAGTGRNALTLARMGHPVDAVEITPGFAQKLREIADQERLDVRVVTDDVFQSSERLRRDYRLLFASEVVPDFRSAAQLRQLFLLAASVLPIGGKLLFNVHLSARGYNPERAARELAQQCYSSLFTPNEIAQAAAGLPFELRDNCSVHEFERHHLPAGQWPPTPWYVNWISGLDVYDLEGDHTPAELRWLTFERVDPANRPATGSSMTAELSSAGRARRFDTEALHQAIARRLMRRISSSATVTLPAIPALAATYSDMAVEMVRSLGRSMTSDQVEALRRDFETTLEAAFAGSQRSNIVVEYNVQTGTDIKYSMTADPVSLSDAYEQWHDNAPDPMFGSHPDARLLSLLDQMTEPALGSVLDVGAGLGRNALYLARRGIAVDALELTPRFAQAIEAEALRSRLSLRTIKGDLFAPNLELRRDYRLIVVSGTAGDFRDVHQLRRLFAIAAESLCANGLLLLGIHVAVDGYVPDLATRQWAQQCCAMFYTRAELADAVVTLPIRLESDVSALEYEREHAAHAAWPPSEAYLEWATTRHMFATTAELCPIELRWLVYRKTHDDSG
ncbi:MAG TPA: methyltransferase domain-containing protein [Polyangiaceae bacterium]